MDVTPMEVQARAPVMTNEELTERIEAFRRALANRQRGEPWYELASRVEEAMRGASAIGYGEDVVKKIASEETGVSPGVLSRYVAVFRKLKGAATASGLNSQGFVGARI